MTRSLRILSADVPVLDALRDALGGGPALMVLRPDGLGDDPPGTVEQRIALIVETSGTTGRPKRVALSADAVLAGAAASESALGGPGQWVLALPTHYIAGLNVLTRSIAAGFDPVVVGGDRFTAKDFVVAARQVTEPVHYVSLVPAQLATLLDDDDARDRLTTFSRVLVGGQSTPRALLDRAAGHGIRVTRTYGSSETSGGCVYDGVPIGNAAVRIEDGEVWLGGPSLAEGYWGDPALTRDRFPTLDGSRWFATADTGRWDGERLTITGRRDDVIISGGVKIALGAVEAALREQLFFADAVVVAADDERWGQVPVAFTTSGADAGPAMAAVGGQLGREARPARVIVVDDLPLLPSGKVDRAALAARAAD